MSSVIILNIPAPPRAVHPNARVHYFARARAVKRYRREVAMIALGARAQASDLPWQRVRADIRFCYPVRRRRDRDNAIAALKPAFDGLQDAGLIADDSGLEIGRVEFCIAPRVPRCGRTILILERLDKERTHE